MTWNTVRCFSFTCKTRAQLLASKNLGTIYQDTIAEATTFCQIDQRTKELCKITNISTEQEVFFKKKIPKWTLHARGIVRGRRPRLPKITKLNILTQHPVEHSPQPECRSHSQSQQPLCP